MPCASLDTFPNLRGVRFIGDTNPGIIDVRMCRRPFAQMVIIYSTPELHHASYCGRESGGTKEFGFVRIHEKVASS